MHTPFHHDRVDTCCESSRVSFRACEARLYSYARVSGASLMCVGRSSSTRRSMRAGSRATDEHGRLLGVALAVSAARCSSCVLAAHADVCRRSHHLCCCRYQHDSFHVKVEAARLLPREVEGVKRTLSGVYDRHTMRRLLFQVPFMTIRRHTLLH